MKKTAVWTMGLAMLMSAYGVAQDDAASKAKEDAKPAVANSCKNRVQVTDLSGVEQSGGIVYDYFLQLSNPTKTDVFLDVKFDNFPDSNRIYSTNMKAVKLKAGKKQTIRFGSGRNNNISPATVTLQIDKEYTEGKGKAAKKPVISLVNCRDKK